MKNLNMGLNIGGSALGIGTSLYSDIKDINSRRDYDPRKNITMDTYNPYLPPSPFQSNIMPEDITRGTGGREALSGAMDYGSMGASLGSAIAPGIGTAIGAVGGALVGVGIGAFKGAEARRDRDEFNRLETLRRHNYDKAVNSYWNTYGDERLAYAQQNEEGKRNDYLPTYGSSIYNLLG